MDKAGAPPRRVLITGATGFIGTPLLARCRAMGWAVRAVTRHAPPARGDGIDWMQADITDPNLDWDGAVAGTDAVFHLAWSTVPFSANRDPAANIETNVAPSLRLADAVARAGSIRLIFVSSGGTVYGVSSAARIDERHATRPTSFYGEGKLTLERHLALFGAMKGLDHTVLRVSNPFGPTRATTANFGAIPTFVTRALRGEELVIWGDGSTVRDYLYVEDVVDALVLAVSHESRETVFNIGSGEGRSLNDIIASLRVILPHAVDVRYEDRRVYDVPVNVLDVALAARELPWTPRTPFEHGLRLTVECLRAAMEGGR